MINATSTDALAVAQQAKQIAENVQAELASEGGSGGGVAAESTTKVMHDKISSIEFELAKMKQHSVAGTSVLVV